jgi:hypothetical protein
LANRQVVHRMTYMSAVQIYRATSTAPSLIGLVCSPTKKD